MVVEELYTTLLETPNLDEKLITQLIKRCISNGYSDNDVILTFLAALRIVGDEFGSKKRYLTDVLHISNHVNAYLLSKSKDITPEENGLNIIIGTIEDDFHDIMKNILSLILLNKGYNVIDLGCAVPTDSFCTCCKETIDCNFIIICSYMQSGKTYVESAISKIRCTSIGKNTAIIVLGSGVDSQFATENGVEYYNSIEAILNRIEA